MNELATVTYTPQIATTSTAQLVAYAMQEQISSAKCNCDIDLYYCWADTLQGNSKTVEQYKKLVYYFISYTETIGVARPTTQTVEQYKEFLLQTKKPSTVANYLSALSRFFCWLDSLNIYPNIVKAVEKVKVNHTEFKHDYFEVDEVVKMLKLFNRNTVKGSRDYAIILLMFTTGIRTVEVVNALISDIVQHGDGYRLYIKGKGDSGRTTDTADKGRYVKIENAVYNAIQNYLSFRTIADASEPLFLSLSRAIEKGTAPLMDSKSISRICKNTFRAIGIDDSKHTAHSLRHTAGTQALINGATLEQVQQLLGHKDIATTKMYVHASTRANNHSEKLLTELITKQL